MRKSILHIIQTAVVSLAAIFATAVSPLMTVATYAQPAEQMAVCASNAGIFGFSPWYACLPGGNTGEPRIESLNDILLIIFPLLESLVKAGAYLAAAFIFYSIIRFILARGNVGKVNTAIEGIRDAVIGFIITLIAIAIVNFIAGAFTPQ